jgi:hypothetical protein
MRRNCCAFQMISKCNFCNQGDPSSGILSDMGMFGQLLPNTRYGYF